MKVGWDQHPCIVEPLEIPDGEEEEEEEEEEVVVVVVEEAEDERNRPGDTHTGGQPDVEEHPVDLVEGLEWRAGQNHLPVVDSDNRTLQDGEEASGWRN